MFHDFDNLRNTGQPWSRNVVLVDGLLTWMEFSSRARNLASSSGFSLGVSSMWTACNFYLSASRFSVL